MRKRALHFNCLPGVLLLLMFCGSSTTAGIDLRCVIVIFLKHTHLLFMDVDGGADQMFDY